MRGEESAEVLGDRYVGLLDDPSYHPSNSARGVDARSEVSPRPHQQVSEVMSPVALRVFPP